MAQVTEADIARYREASGYQSSDDPLVLFLYLLGRDHLPLGVVEEIMLKVAESSQNELSSSQYTEFCNGWLAQWAAYTASRLAKGETVNPVAPTPPVPVVVADDDGLADAGSPDDDPIADAETIPVGES